MTIARRLRTAIATIAIALVVGCGHKSNKIVGVWDIKGGPGQATFTFTADGNFTTKATMPGRQSSVLGQYHLDGDKLTLTTTQQRTATLQWHSDDEALMTGDDGKAMTIVRHK